MDLKDRTDIVDVVRRYASDLKKRGKNWVCRSPFRNERTPSFSVSQEKQFWYDFGLGEGGDVISFLERVENVSFREAVETLADTQNVALPDNWGQERGEGGSGPKVERKTIYDLHEAACVYFTQELERCAVAKEYLRDGRGFDAETVKQWRLGYAGEARDGLTKYLLERGYTHEQIGASGVAYERQFGDRRMVDRFTGRVMIPICEPRNGHIIAFSGRDIGRTPTGKNGKVAKYINSPENAVYHKSATLFGLDQARAQVAAADYIVLVEGNFDVISAHRAGVPQAVATCGTALTEDHLRHIKRRTKRVVVAFDTDAAGKKATLRATEMLLGADLSPYIVQVAGGKDIDELAQTDPGAVVKLIEGREPALEFFRVRFGQKLLDGSLEGEQKFLEAYFYFLSRSPRPLEHDHYLTAMAKQLNRPKGVLEQEFARYKDKHQRQRKEKYVPETKGPLYGLEEKLLGLVAGYETVRGVVDWGELEPLLTDEGVESLLRRVLQGGEMNEVEGVRVNALVLHQQNQWGETLPSAEQLEGAYKTVLTLLRREADQRKRLLAAAELRSSLARGEKSGINGAQ